MVIYSIEDRLKQIKSIVVPLALLAAIAVSFSSVLYADSLKDTEGVIANAAECELQHLCLVCDPDNDPNL